MIVGIGVDVVNVARFGATLARTPGVRDRLFTVQERSTDDGHARPVASLAVRFAAKEAVAKALGAPSGMRWVDCEVVSDGAGRPWLQVTGTVAEVADSLGADAWHLSLTHDGDYAIAYVIAESAMPLADCREPSVVAAHAEQAPAAEPRQAPDGASTPEPVLAVIPRSAEPGHRDVPGDSEVAGRGRSRTAQAQKAQRAGLSLVDLRQGRDLPG